MKTKDVSQREKELFEKIKGMSYQEALDKYLEESIAIELEKHDILQEYSSLAVTNNLFILRNAKKRIYDNRGTEVRNKETSAGGIVFFIIALIYCLCAFSKGYDYSPTKIVFCIVGFFVCLIFYSLNKTE